MCPLDMRILDSRDPDGRIVEAIMRGEKVNSSDFSAMATHSKKYLSNTQNVSDQVQYTLYHVKQPSDRNNPPPPAKKPAVLKPVSPNAHDAETRQAILDAHTAKRRARRAKRK